MKLKLVMITAATMLCLTAALLWLMDEKISEERRMALESGLRGPVNALSQALQADLRGLRRALPAGTVLSRQDWKSFRPFFALAQIRLDHAKPEILQFAVDPKGPGASWGVDGASALLSNWQKLPAQEDGSGLIPQQDPKTKRPIFAVLVRDGDRNWVAWAGPEFLQGILDLQKGPRGVLAIINARGEILAHSTAEYVGTQAAEGSIYERMLADTDMRADKEFESSSNEVVFGSFEKVPRGGFTVMAFRPVTEMLVERFTVLLYGGLAGLGLLLLATSLVWRLATKWEMQTAESVFHAVPAWQTFEGNPAPPAKGAEPGKSAAKAAAAPKAVSASISVSPIVEHSTKAAPALSAKEQNEASMRVAAVFGHELRGPLTSILGFCQMILSSSNDKRVTDPVDSILRETRSARDVVEKIMSFAGETNAEKKPARLETALAKVLKDYDLRLNQKHVKVGKELRETAMLPLSMPAIENVLKHLLNNAIDATDRMQKKEISLKLTEEVEFVQLEIKDNGEGMDDAQKAKALEPFFTTRNTSTHMGLGLSAAAGILKEHGAQMRIDSARGKGTTVTLIFPKKPKTVEIAGEKVELRTEQKVEIPSSLPSAPNAGIPGLRTLAPPAVEDLTFSGQTRALMGKPEENINEGTSVGTSAGTQTGVAPTNVDIEDLLAMPPESSHPVALRKETRPLEDRTIVVDSTGPSMVPDPAAANVAAAASAASAASAAASVAAAAAKESERVTTPKFAAPKRTDKLASVQVEIRRPGARPE